jgi:Uma2 family endonuclease
MTTLVSTDSELVYPDRDGLPMSDNTKQFRWIVLIKENLEILFADDPQVFVAGDLLWYPVKGRPDIRVAPDAMVVFGRPKGDRGSYKEWEEDNIAPQVVFEVLSPGNTISEMSRKLLFYERYGVREYYIYDPDGKSLDGYIRGEQTLLESIVDTQGWISPCLNVRFEMTASGLVIFRPDGEPFFSPVALYEQSRQARQRADEAEQRAEEERQRAIAAQVRADRLASRLRDLGIDPEGV